MKFLIILAWLNVVAVAISGRPLSIYDNNHKQGYSSQIFKNIFKKNFIFPDKPESPGEYIGLLPRKTKAPTSPVDVEFEINTGQVLRDRDDLDSDLSRGRMERMSFLNDSEIALTDDAMSVRRLGQYITVDSPLPPEQGSSNAFSSPESPDPVFSTSGLEGPIFGGFDFGFDSASSKAETRTIAMMMNDKIEREIESLKGVQDFLEGLLVKFEGYADEDDDKKIDKYDDESKGLENVFNIFKNPLII